MNKAFSHPFQDPDLGIEERLSNLLSLMTLEEKIRCLGTVPSVPRLGVVGTGHVEGLHGLAMGEPGGWAQGYPVPTTQFCQAIGMAETWDTALIQRAGRAEGLETRHLWESPKYKRGGLVVRAPNADLGRDPRWGRTEECFGEDPFFNGSMACAMTRGLQGEHPKYLLTASLLKHFLANSNEDLRSSTSSDFDERLFHEYYSVPFRMAIREAKANGYMAAYNAVNSVPAHVHPVLKEVTMDQWGHDGLICTDGGAMNSLFSDHKYYPDLPMTAAAIIKAGIGQFLDKHAEPTRAALQQGLLTEQDVDASLAGVFRVMIRLGQLDPPELVPYRVASEEDPWDSEAHRALALEVAQKSVVLLKNDNETLPLDPKRLKSIAVIGNNADEVFFDWYSGTPPYAVSPLEGIKKRLGASVQVRFAKDDQDGRAVALAKESDVVIFCAGNHPTGNHGWGKIDSPMEGKEAFDRQSIGFRQEELAKALYRANPNTILVLVSSFPIAINWAQLHLPAILHVTHNGQELGNAVAGALFGDINPGGRLVQTWPRSLEQLPPMMDYNIRNGRTYMYFKHEPLYPFGFGLSYTHFSYAGLKIAKADQGGFSASVEVSNAGKRAGDEVVQLYVRHLDSEVERPGRELKGFARISIEPGKKQRVDFRVKGSDLAYWNTGNKNWRSESGKIKVMVGASSSDIRAEGVVHVEA
ncbi:MAG: glycoside hydrolase family 3 C-terminal domain-containing protein [candidate division FCPU426 bacterium]